MPLQDITITASINSLVTQSYGQRTYIASTDDQSFPIETITGSYAGAWPNFVEDTNYTTGLIVNITQSWSESIVTPLGIVSSIHKTNEEFFNGEFSGSSYTVSDGTLVDEDCLELLKPNTTPIIYRIPAQTAIPSGIYSSSYFNNVYIGDQLSTFYNTSPSLGLIYIYVRKNFDNVIGDYFISIEKIQISKYSYDDGSNWIDQTLSLQELKEISWYDSDIFDTAGGNITLKVLNITEKPNHFIYDVQCFVTQLNGVISNQWYQGSSAVNVDNNNHFFVIEPYLLSNFNNSDCDVLMNNASLNDISTTRQKVLYDDGSTIPSNIDQILAGNAEAAEINDYLFNASDSILPRYLGTRTTSPGFNLPSVIGYTSTILSEIDPNLSNASLTPNVEQTTTYFGYFTSLKANWPIYKGTTSPVLKYIIREDGTTFSPSSDEATYYNTLDSFPKGAKAYTNLLSNTTTIFNSTQSILLSGESYKPVMYTITASTYNAAYFASPPVIDFTNLNGGTTATSTNYDFLGQSVVGFSQIGPGVTRNIFTNPGTNPAIKILYDTASGYYTGGTPGILSTPSYRFNGTPTSFVKIECSGRFYTSPIAAGGLAGTFNPSAFRFELWLLRGSTTSSLGFLANSANSLSKNIDQTFTVNHFPLPNDEIYATISNLGTTSIKFQYVPQIKIITQNATPASVSTTFWTTGSSYDTVLTSSLALGAVINGGYKQVDIVSSNFEPIEVPSQPQIGDEIRFEYDEDFTYRIIDVLPTSSGTSPITYLTLDKPVPPGGFDLNHFTIRRKVKDYITGIALDADLILPIDEGFLLPEWPSSDLKKNLPTIVSNLSNRNLI